MWEEKGCWGTHWLGRAHIDWFMHTLIGSSTHTWFLARCLGFDSGFVLRSSGSSVQSVRTTGSILHWNSWQHDQRCCTNHQNRVSLSFPYSLFSISFNLSSYPLSRSLPPSFPSSRSNFLSRALSRQTGVAMSPAAHEPSWPSSSPESGLSTQVGPATSRHRRQRLTAPMNTLIKKLTFIGKTQLLLARLNVLTVDEDINKTAIFYVFMCISGGIKGEHFYTQKTIVSLTLFSPPSLPSSRPHLWCVQEWPTPLRSTRPGLWLSLVVSRFFRLPWGREFYLMHTLSVCLQQDQGGGRRGEERGGGVFN